MWLRRVRCIFWGFEFFCVFVLVWSFLRFVILVFKESVKEGWGKGNVYLCRICCVLDGFCLLCYFFFKNKREN